MDAVKHIFKGIKTNEIFIMCILSVYIIFDIRTPQVLAEIVDSNLLVKIIATIIIFTSYFYIKPVIFVLLLVAFWEFIKRAKKTNQFKPVYKYLPTHDKKDKTLNALNQFPHTLEEEMVSTMAPLVRHSLIGDPSYLPILDNDGFAAPIDYVGVN
jgi:hypothetical protein